jgi:hypothetical protein
MSTIIHIALTPTDTATVTPLEVLEDFADATPGWHYLDEESTLYAREKGVPACVIRYQTKGDPRYVDVAFAASADALLSDLELVLLDAPTPEEEVVLEARNAVLDRFLDRIGSYLEARPDHVRLHVDEADVDAAKKPS